MGKSIGIDLGTTNSSMAIKDGERPRILPNAQREEQTPSVVSIYDRTGEILVGSRAKRNGPLNPPGTIYSIKRLMGKEFEHPDVKAMMDKVSYQMVPADEGTGVRVMFKENKSSPIEISSLILKKLKEDAKKRLGEEVTQAVITVPAYFTDAQKEATRQAGLAAGLHVKMIIEEPSAAALAFGMGLDPDEVRTIAAFDLGGGTFDVSILAVAGGRFEVMNLEGNNWLGGDDFDNKIIEYVLEQVQKRHGVDGRTDPSFMADLKDAAEKAKIELSETASALINFRTDLRDSKRELVDVNLEITREQFNNWIRPYIIGPHIVDEIDKAAIPLTQKAIAGSHFTIDEIDHVLLVGGSTAIPMIKDELAAIFGEDKIEESVNPMNVVAEGAAILAAMYTGIQCPNPECLHKNPADATKCEECDADLAKGLFVPENEEDDIVGGTVAMTYGIAVKGGGFEYVLPKNTPYPTLESVMRTFYTVTPNQPRLYIPVYQTEEPPKPVAKDNMLQGIVQVDLKEHFPEGLDLNTPIDVKMAVDRNGIISVQGTSQGVDFEPIVLRETSETIIARGEGTTGEEGDDYQSLDPEWKKRLEYGIVIANIVLQYRPLLEPTLSGKFDKLITEGKQALEREDEAAGERILQDLENAMEEMKMGKLGSTVDFLVSCDFVANYTNLGDPTKREALSAQLSVYKDAMASRRIQQGNETLKEIEKAWDELTPTLPRMEEFEDPLSKWGVSQEQTGSAGKTSM